VHHKLANLVEALWLALLQQADSPSFHSECCALLLLQQERYSELNDVLHTALRHTAEPLVHIAHSDGSGKAKWKLQVKPYNRHLQQKQQQQHLSCPVEYVVSGVLAHQPKCEQPSILLLLLPCSVALRLCKPPVNLTKAIHKQ
jgi:hypothetical protein